MGHRFQWAIFRFFCSVQMQAFSLAQTLNSSKISQEVLNPHFLSCRFLPYLISKICAQILGLDVRQLYTRIDHDSLSAKQLNKPQSNISNSTEMSVVKLPTICFQAIISKENSPLFQFFILKFFFHSIPVSQQD